jgi:hypothetical protein
MDAIPAIEKVIRGELTMSASVLLWPFTALWSLLSFILRLTGRLLAGILGLVFMIVGLLLTFLIVAAPVGIPLIVVGFLLLIRSIF